MPTMTIVTGAGGAGVAIAAAALALNSAAERHTLLLSLGPAPGLAALSGVVLGPEPVAAIPQLELLALDPGAALASVWEHARTQLPLQFTPLSADELPLVPGMGALFGLVRLRELGPRYQHIVVDAGSHDTLLQALMLPDGMRWLTRLLLGLDRGAGQSNASIGRAILPSGFLPGEAVNGAQEARIEAERLRATLIDPNTTTACFVLRPDAVGLAEARLALPALQLYGLAVAELAAGPLLPATEDSRFGILLQQQEIYLSEAQKLWPSRPFVRFEAPAAPGLAGLERIAPQFAAAGPRAPVAGPISEVSQGQPALVIELPGLPNGALGLTLSGDELIIRIGHYRRHVLLPDGMRGTTSIKATREGETLVVRRRT